jgi:hypothetical protein
VAPTTVVSIGLAWRGSPVTLASPADSGATSCTRPAKRPWVNRLAGSATGAEGL